MNTTQDSVLRAITSKLEALNVNGEVIDVRTGPVVSTALFRPAPKTRIGALQRAAQDLSIAARGQVRVFPVPDQGAVAIEYPNSVRQVVTQADLPASQRLTVPLGLDTYGQPVIVDLAQLPHLLIAGTTGSGKSMLLHSIILSLLEHNTARQLQLVLIDPKMVELTPYRSIAHLRNFATDAAKALECLEEIADVVEERYAKMAAARVRKASDLGLPAIVVVIDELADLMTCSEDRKAFEQTLKRLAQKARAASVHLIVATQRPSVDVITGVVKANLPARLSFQLPSLHDSRTVINEGGAENLLGKGDGLFRGAGIQTRLQCAYVADSVIADIAASCHRHEPVAERWSDRLRGWWGRLKERNTALLAAQ